MQYSSLKFLADYPRSSFFEDLAAVESLLPEEYPAESRLALQEFVSTARTKTLAEMQETYTQAFDFDPDCSLELSWHLYGENYGRGDFLVKMRDMLQRFNITETVELPDHLIHVLEAFDHLSREEAQAFAGHYILPAMEKLLQGITSKDNLYKHALQGIYLVLKVNNSLPTAAGGTT